ncbi:hypothetical protein [Lentzea sp. NPDC055074]
MFSAPPPSGPPARRGTPLAHCAAGAAVWYVALIAAFVIVGLRSGEGLGRIVPVLLVGAALFAVTTFTTYLILLRIRLQPWVLILVTLLVYFVTWSLIRGVMGALGAVFRMMVG